LRGAGIAFEVCVPKVEEPTPGEWEGTPEGLAQTAARGKALSLVVDHRYRVILAADTVVALDGCIFGKPKDRDDARQMLSQLSGTTQEVITGVAIMHPSEGRQIIDHDVTRVTMKKMSDDELEAYLDGGEWEGKAGAYGIQGKADRFVEKVEGSYTNVVGLPMELVLDRLAGFGIRSVDEPA
jgi:septum formation protein